MASRPDIPEPLRRAVLMEARHGCAICGRHHLEVAHIDPWERVREHTFENLIALCPNCHTRYDRGEIDRQAMLQYKRNLAEGRFAFQAAPAPPPDPEEVAINELRGWWEESEERFGYRRFFERVDENPDRYHAGTWTMAYGLFGEFKAGNVLQLRPVLQQATWYPISWPLWQERSMSPPRRPRPVGNTYELWLGDMPDWDGWYSHFWRASPEGFMYLKRGYWEDREDVRKEFVELRMPAVPGNEGRALFMEQAIRCVGTALVHAKDVSTRLTGDARKLVAMFRWDGLKGRCIQRDPRTSLPWPYPRMAEQDVVESMLIVPSTDELNEEGLANHVAEAIRPLYVAYEIEVDDPGVRGIISRELRALLQGN